MNIHRSLTKVQNHLIKGRAHTQISVQKKKEHEILAKMIICEVSPQNFALHVTKSYISHSRWEWLLRLTLNYTKWSTKEHSSESFSNPTLQIYRHPWPRHNLWCEDNTKSSVTGWQLVKFKSKTKLPYSQLIIYQSCSMFESEALFFFFLTISNFNHHISLFNQHVYIKVF